MPSFFRRPGRPRRPIAGCGVIAPLVGIVGSVQAMEAVKLIAGVGETLVGYVLYLDAKRMGWRVFTLPKNPKCAVCGKRGEPKN